jgi:hypothetical protein
MNRPEDTPEDVWEIARELLGEPDTVTRPKNIERAARVLMAYGQRRADEAREKAAQAIEDHEIWHGSEGDGLRQRTEGNRSGLAYAAFIRSQK